jgi:hypothetical protein
MWHMNQKALKENGWQHYDKACPRTDGVQIAIADAAENTDHLVSPEEAIRIAMARQ